MHLGSNNVSVSKVGLATHSAPDGPYMDTYLVHQTEGMPYPGYVLPCHHSCQPRNHWPPGAQINSGKRYIPPPGLSFFSTQESKDHDYEDSGSSDEAACF